LLTDALCSLGVLFNTSPGLKIKGKVREWAKPRYPEAWQRLEEDVGMVETGRMFRYKVFNVDRGISA